MIGLSDYATIKNNYCIGYFGHSKEYILQLKLLRSFLESTFKGLNIYISCKDDSFDILDKTHNVIKLSELKSHKHKFAYIKEIKAERMSHPIEELLKSSNINNCHICDPFDIQNYTCLIVSQGNYPTLSLTEKQINILKKIAYDKGLSPIVDKAITSPGMVMGVESIEIFNAAYKQIPTLLVPTGNGTRLYKMMFPNNQILNI